MAEINSTARIPSRSVPKVQFRLEYLKSVFGVLSVIQWLLGIVTVGLSFSYQFYINSNDFISLFSPIVYTIFCLISTGILIWSVLDINCDDCPLKNCINKYSNYFSMAGCIYYTIATALLLSVSIALTTLQNQENLIDYDVILYDGTTATLSIGYINAILHFVSVIYAIRTYKNSSNSLQQARINIYGINPASGLDKDKGISTIY